MKYFPITTLVSFGCLQKYASQKFPNLLSYNASVYYERIATMRLVGEFAYIAYVEDPLSPFLQVKKNYYFGNPCAYNPKILIPIGINQTTC